VADQPNAVEDHTRQLQLELRLDRQPISGRLRTQQGAEEAFEGWLGFADALRRLHELPPQPKGSEPVGPIEDAGFGEHAAGGSTMRKITASLFISLDGVVEAHER
jgi:hypothetical protein